MDVTRQNLLIRAHYGEQGAGDDLPTLYGPLIVAWLHRKAVANRDLDDLVQKVVLAVYLGKAKSRYIHKVS
jgi:hypothetical protein